MTNVFGMVTTRASARYTGPALESFFRHTPLSAQDRFLLIDNDGAWPEAAPTAHPRIEIVRNSSPKGFAANANQALEIARSSGADLFFLNNDLIFPESWIDPLLVSEPAILSPLSAKEVQYACSAINTKTQASQSAVVFTNPFDLESYLECPQAFDYVAAVHRKKAQGYWPLYVVPFFAVKIPFSVLSVVGRFDEAFGLGGAEDYDYCLRAVLAGFRVQYALGSYLLHFAGKSSWAGPEDAARKAAREAQFMRHFEAKWGPKIFDMFFHENAGVISSNPELKSLEEQGQLKPVIEALMEGRQVSITL